MVDWASGVDVERPNIARVYDYLLGGAHNFAVDRELARRGLELLSNLADAARFNRAFLFRAVRFCLDRGIRQFLDLGSGIPTAGNVHEVAHASFPSSRVVYVDNEAVAVEQSAALLRRQPNASVAEADIRDPGAVLRHPEVIGMLDFDEPVAVLLVAVLHSVPDQDDPAGLVARYRGAMAPGSFLALSHGPRTAVRTPCGATSSCTSSASTSARTTRCSPCWTASTWSRRAWSGPRCGARSHRTTSRRTPSAASATRGWGSGPSDYCGLLTWPELRRFSPPGRRR